MKPQDPKIIEYLNRVLKNELTAINQYFLHSRMFKDWGLKELGEHEHQESVDERKHTDAWSERIRHNFLESYKTADGRTNAERPRDWKRRMYVVGRALDLAYAVRGVAAATGEEELYSAAMSDRAEAAADEMLEINDRGVLPRMLTLDNGVTLASYGRPGLFVRATADPSGLEWEPRVTVVEPLEQRADTCSYSRLLALDERTALLAYSDFNYPDAQGRKRKSLLVRTVTAS